MQTSGVDANGHMIEIIDFEKWGVQKLTAPRGK